MYSYLSIEDQHKIRRLQLNIESNRKELMALRRKYDEISYGIIDINGNFRTKKSEEIKKEIDEVEREIRSLENTIEQIENKAFSEGRKREKQSLAFSTEREKQKSIEKEQENLKRTAYSGVKYRWAWKSCFYKLFHLKTRPSVIEKGIDNWTAEELNNLHK